MSRLFLFLIISIAAEAQTGLRWNVNLGENINWFTIAPNGMLITAQVISNDSISFTRLSWIDQETGKVKSTFEPPRKDVVISGIDFFPGTNKYQPRDLPLILLDPNDGHMLFELRDTYHIETNNLGVIDNTSKLWMESSDSARVFCLFDFEVQKLLWQNTAIYDGAAVANKISIGNKSFTSRKATAASLLCTPLILKDEMIVVTQQGIFKISLATGLVIWRTSLPDAPTSAAVRIDLHQAAVRLFKGDKHFFIIKGQYITAFNYEDGTAAWINAVKTSGPVEQIYINEKGMVLMPGFSETKGVYGETRLTMVNETTGENLWPQGPSFNGTVTHYASTSKGLAVVMKNSIDINTINIVDWETGKFLWPASVRVSGQMEKFEVVPKGLLYQSIHAVNILGFDGNPVLDLSKQSVLKKPTLTLNTEEKLYYFSTGNNNFYEIDKREGTCKMINQEPVNFKTEEPKYIDMLADGILLHGDQNAMAFSSDGRVKFSVYYPSPLNFFAQIKKDIKKMVPQNTKKDTLTNAPNNTLKPTDYLYMMTRIDRLAAMVVIDKNSGQEITSVNFIADEDKPSYRLDKERGVLFYAPKGKDDFGNPTYVGQIQCWKF